MPNIEFLLYKWIRITTLVFFFVLQIGILSAQKSESDSLFDVYSKSKNDKDKINKGLDLLWSYRNEGKFKEAVRLGNSLIEASSEKNLPLYLAEAYQRMANIYDDLSVYDTALTYISKAINLHSRLKEEDRLCNDYSIKGGIFYNLSQYNNSLDNYLIAIKYANRLKNRTDIARIYNSLGNIYKDMNNYTKSFNYRMEAVRVYMNKKNPIQAALIYTNMVFDLFNMPDTSLVAIHYNRKMQNDSIIRYAVFAYNVFDKENIPIGKAAVLGNVGLWFHKIGLYDTALVCQKRCFEMYKEMNMTHDMSAALGDLSMVYVSQKKYDNAIESGLEARKLALSVDNIYALDQINRNLYKAYKGKSNIVQALFFHEQWKIINDSLRDEDEKRSVTTKGLNYEFNKRAMADSIAAAELRQSDKLKHENEIAVQRTYTYAGIFGLVLMMVIALLAIKAYRQKKNDNLIISQQKQIVEEHQKEILDSIHYAKRIQSAILAKPEEIKEYLPESFLIYKPKDIVAGDFYFFETTSTHLFYAAADCTGHGVPGALVSVVCSNALSRCVKEFGLTNPGEILTKARELVLDTFKKSGQEVKDGMDISFVSISKKELQKENGMKIEWAGAFNPLWYSVEKEMKECKANKQPIGLNENPEPFTSHTLNLEKGNTFYLFTDGYADQFGGPKGKKFKYKKLEELLVKISVSPMDEQSEILVKEFETWRGELEQVDDVCIIGVRV